MTDEKSDYPNKEKKQIDIEIRQMEIDDIATVFHMGEYLFKAKQVPNLYRTWDEYEVITFFQGDPEFCLVAEVESEKTIVGFILGTTITKSHSAWKYGLMVWLGIHPDFQRFKIATKLFREFKALMLENGVRMLLADTEADNVDALKFFKQMGFKNPEKHVYLSLNLAAELRTFKKKDSNGKAYKER